VTTADPDRRRVGLIPLLLLGGGLLLAVVISAGLIGFDATSNLKASNESVVGSSERLTVANQLELRVIDLQTGVRGFVITGDPSFLAPRNQALRQIPRLERRLLAGLPPTGRATLGHLFKRIERYMSGVQPRVLSLARRDLEAARRLIATGIGNDVVDAMRREFASFDRAQSAERVRRKSTAERRASRAKAIQLVGLGAALVLVGIADLPGR
jgi:CHASE3 domain sensor protein